MNKFNFTKFFIIIAIMLCPTMFYGQSKGNVEKMTFNDFEHYLYVSGDLGLGILSADNVGNSIRMNGHLGLGFQFDNILGAKLNLGYGGLNGKYNNAKISKLNYFESSLNLTINFVDIILGYDPDRKISVSPHFGIGQIQYRTEVQDNEGNTTFRTGFNDNKDGNVMGDGIGRRRVVASLPMGLEVNYDFTKNWSAFIDITATYTDTDALDGFVSGTNDWFTTANIGATYKLRDKANIFKHYNEYCNHWFASIEGGASFLFGDNNFNFNDIKGNGNIGIGYNFSNHYRIYTKLGYGIYAANQASNFTLEYADYYEVNINIAADIVGMIFGYNETRRIALYPHIGIGQMQYKSTTVFDNGKVVQYGYRNDAEYNNKGGGIFGRRVVMTVPLGAEFTYKINSNYEAFFDATVLYASSDILDGVTSGNSRDMRSTLNAGFRYKFNNSCYRVEEETAPVQEAPECITPEEIKEAIKKAIEDQEAVTAETIREAIENAIEDSVIYNQNFTNIVFPISKSEKLDSQTNIDAINRASQEMKQGSAVNKIIVEGYASPDGSKELNDRLAEERAKEAAELVKRELGTNVEIEINSKGADWAGLIKAIEGSDLENKNEIANEIRTSSNREQTLRKLMAEYPQIKDLLPQLRRAGVTITTVK